MTEKGHWYTDKNGNHYFVKEGETPKEGWERSKRRKMIDGGKYKVDDGDGKGTRDVEKDEYDKYEADSADFDENVEDDFGFDETDESEYADEEMFYNIRTQYMSEGGDFEDMKKKFPDVDDNLIRAAMNTDINNFDDYLDYRDKKGGWSEEEENEADRMKEKFADRFTEEEMDAAAERVSRKHGMSKEKAKEMLFGGEEIDEEIENELEDWGDYVYSGLDAETAAKTLAKRKNIPLERAKGFFEAKNDDGNITNDWKPSEEVTLAYDAGGFYSINEGDEWDFQDGGFVKVEKVNGDEVTIRTPGGNRETITKDELSERVKHASKVPVSGNNPFPDRDGWNGKSAKGEYKPIYDYEDFGDARYYKNNSGSGREYHDIASAHGISDEESYRKDFKNRFKYVGQTKDGVDIYQGPDGYFSTNPLITSMSFKTKEALQDYEDKRTTDYAYGGYNKDNPNISAPEAYTAARRKAIRAAEDKDVSNRKINHIMEYFDIWGKPSEREFDDVVKHYGLNDSESNELRKKLFGKK